MALGQNGAYPMDQKSTLMTNDNKKNSKKSSKLKAHVTFLEMDHAPIRNIPVPTKPTIALIRAENIPSQFYRYLYELVGKDHHWEDRRNLFDAKLYSLINHEKTEISVLYADGCPAGFFELNKENHPESIEILYLGLAKEYQGLGLGKWFTNAAISAAWTHKPEKIKIQTNTLDHPAALQLYQRLGFSPVATSDVEIEEWK